MFWSRVETELSCIKVDLQQQDWAPLMYANSTLVSNTCMTPLCWCPGRSEESVAGRLFVGSCISFMHIQLSFAKNFRCAMGRGTQGQPYKRPTLLADRQQTRY